MSADLLERLQSSLGARYALERELARGGMATVYVAQDLRHDRRVAVKVMHPELSALLGAERFAAEVRVTARLQHPNILPLFDSGEAEGQLYYVMPFVDGESLRTRLERERMLPIDEAIKIATDVAAALEHAHGEGIIHRDIKPENILLLRDGTALVADFGIALALSHAGGERLTQTGLSLGTPQYMAPEQATASGAVDRRADIYALGCVLYEMLVGEAPFTGPTAGAIIARSLTETPRPIRTTRDAVPIALESAVAKALAKLPADRFRSARDLVEALRTGERSSTVAPVPMARIRRTMMREVALVALGAAVATGLTLLVRGKAPPDDTRFVMRRHLTYTGDVVGVAISPDGKWLASLSDNCTPKPRPPCAYTLHVREIDGQRAVSVLTWKQIAWDIRWTADGASLLFQGAPGDGPPSVYLVDRLGGAPRRIRSAVSGLAVHPDGAFTFVAGAAGNQWLVRHDPKTFAPIDSARLTRGIEFVQISWSPGGELLAASYKASAYTWSVMLLDRAGRVVDSTDVGATRAPVRWTPDGRAILTFDVDSAEVPPGLDLISVPVVRGRLRPDRRSVALGYVPNENGDGQFDIATTGRLVVQAGNTQAEMRTASLDSAPIWRQVLRSTGFVGAEPITFDDSGDSIVTAASDNLNYNVHIVPFGGGEPRAVTAQRTWRAQATFSPDRKLVAFAAPTSHAGVDLVLRDADGGPERRVAHHVEQFFWLATDRLLVTRSRRLTEIDTSGRELDTIAIPDSLANVGVLGFYISTIAFDRASRRLAWWSNPTGAIVSIDWRRKQWTVLARSATPLTMLAWTREGSLIVADLDARAERPMLIYRVSLPDGQLRPIAERPRDCYFMAADASGRRVACSVLPSELNVWLAELAH